MLFAIIELGRKAMESFDVCLLLVPCMQSLRWLGLLVILMALLVDIVVLKLLSTSLYTLSFSRTAKAMKKKEGLISHLVPIISSFVPFSPQSFKVVFLVSIVYILILFQSLQFESYFLVLIICILISFQSLQFESGFFSSYTLYFNSLLVLTIKI